MLLFFLSFAAAAELTVFTVTPAVVSVDGQVLEYEEANLLLTARNLKGGKHTIKVESLGRKPITSMELTLQTSERVDLVYGQRTLERVGGGLVGEPAVTATQARVPGMGIGMGPALVVVHTTAAPPMAPVPPAPPPPPKPEPVEVVFSVKDSFDMSNVYVDGRRVAEFRTGDREKTVTLMSGSHTVEIKDFTEFDTWFKGTLDVTPGEPLRFRFGEEDGVELYNRPASAWAPK